MSLVPADAVTVLLNRESAAKVAGVGAKSWLVIQPNVSGIASFRAGIETISRDILSKNLTNEAGAPVGMTVAPKITLDLGKDVADAYAGDMYRCAPKHFGNKGQSLYRPTAVTATGFTVAALGDLSDGILIDVQGSNIAANNGLKKCAGAVALEIKVPGLTIEGAPPANMTLDVVGYQGIATELVMDAAGAITSGTKDLTTLGLQDGQWIKVGGTAAGTFFAVGGSGFAQVDGAPVAGKIALKNHSWAFAADPAVGKTIQIFSTRFFRNYPLGTANFSKSTTQMEMEQVGAGAGGVSSFRYAKGCRVGMFEVDAPLKNKITLALTFVGMDVPDPVLQAARPADTATPLDPLAVAFCDTSADMKYIKLSRAADNTDLGSEIESWTLTQSLKIKAQEIQGVFGANGHIDGKMDPQLKLNTYLTTDDLVKVVRSHEDVQFVAIFGNEEASYAFHIPAAKLSSEEETFGAGDAVKLQADIPAHRGKNGIESSLTVFGYLP